MNKRQKKKRRKRLHALVAQLMREARAQMPPEGWCPPLMYHVFHDPLIKIPKLKRGCPSLD